MQLLSSPSRFDALPHVSFATLMELYETNYLRFRRLAPDCGNHCRHRVSSVEGALDLHLHVLETTRFTTTAILTHHLLETDGATSPLPDLKLRVYRDARQAEALPAIVSEHAWIPDTREWLHQRWRANRFLYKWLGYCLRQGHRFPADAVADTGEIALPG